jgi:hypothetical protein
MLPHSNQINSLSIKNTLKTSQDINTCKNLNLNFDLDRNRFSGDWYPLSFSSDYYTDMIDPNCWTLNFKNLNETHVEMSAFNRKDISNKVYSFTLPALNNNTFYGESQGIQGSVSVIDTDYENYAVFYKCIVSQGKNFYSVAILGRNTSLPEEMIKNIENYITSTTGFTKFMRAEQSDMICRPEIMG